MIMMKMTKNLRIKKSNLNQKDDFARIVTEQISVPTSVMEALVPTVLVVMKSRASRINCRLNLAGYCRVHGLKKESKMTRIFDIFLKGGGFVRVSGSTLYEAMGIASIDIENFRGWGEITLANKPLQPELESNVVVEDSELDKWNELLSIFSLPFQSG